MALSIGNQIPSARVTIVTEEGVRQVDSAEYLGAGKIALFAVPGAFTPTCSAQHLPSFIKHADALRDKGIDRIVCMSVNDAFVLKAWADAHGAVGTIDMLADGNGDLARALGLELDATGFGMGQRSKRFSAIIDNGVLTHLNVETGGAYEVSSAEALLKQL